MFHPYGNYTEAIKNPDGKTFAMCWLGNTKSLETRNSPRAELQSVTTCTFSRTALVYRSSSFPRYIWWFSKTNNPIAICHIGGSVMFNSLHTVHAGGTIMIIDCAFCAKYVWMLSVWVLWWFPLIQGIYTACSSTYAWWWVTWKLVDAGNWLTVEKWCDDVSTLPVHVHDIGVLLSANFLFPCFLVLEMPSRMPSPAFGGRYIRPWLYIGKLAFYKSWPRPIEHAQSAFGSNYAT